MSNGSMSYLKPNVVIDRNVLVASLPSLSHLHEECYRFAASLSDKLLPKTSAYHEIWLDKKMVAGDAVKDIEPMYGPYYLPRKVWRFPLTEPRRLTSSVQNCGCHTPEQRHRRFRE
jgi:sulfite reductase beta subunit-like hemoprotein